MDIIPLCHKPSIYGFVVNRSAAGKYLYKLVQHQNKVKLKTVVEVIQNTTLSAHVSQSHQIYQAECLKCTQ